MGMRGSGSTRWARGVVALLAVVLVGSGCGAATTGAPAAAPPPARVVTTPGDLADAVNPAAPIEVTAVGGFLTDVALTADDGTPVPGALRSGRQSWAASVPLAYDRTYRWSGTSVSTAGTPAPVTGSFRTLAPRTTMRASFAYADDARLGTAAPVILQFDGVVPDKAAAQRALSVATSIPQDGAWAWLPDTAEGSRVHYRPREYWKPGTVVDASARLVGIDLGGGVYGAADVTNHFTIERSLVARADIASGRFSVVRDGRTVMDVPAATGRTDDPVLITRGGPHVVSAKSPVDFLSNPAYDYANVYVRWAVRLNNNGEFTHHNPAALSPDAETHGCINMSEDDARAFYDMVIEGDPVEVVNSPVMLSAADGDIYDWAVPWEQWQRASALT